MIQTVLADGGESLRLDMLTMGCSIEAVNAVINVLKDEASKEARKKSYQWNWTMINKNSVVYLVGNDTERTVLNKAGFLAYNVHKDWHPHQFAKANVYILTEDNIEGRRWGFDVFRQVMEAASGSLPGTQAIMPRIQILDFSAFAASFSTASCRVICDSSWEKNPEIEGYTFDQGIDDYSSLPEKTIDERFVWHETLPVGGIGLLSGLSKIGKTTFCHKLAVAVSKGETVLGRPTVRGRVLYVAFEGNKYEIQQQLKNAGADDGGVITYVGPKPKNREMALRALIEGIAIYQPTMVIVDTMQKMISCANLNSYDAGEEAMDPFVNLAKETGVSILFNHHDDKNGRGSSGSEIFKGSCDVYLHLTSRRGKRFLESEKRVGLVLPLTELSGDSSENLETNNVDVLSLQAEIVQLLRVTPGLCKPAIASAIKKSGKDTLEILSAMMARGELRRGKVGKKEPFYLTS